MKINRSIRGNALALWHGLGDFFLKGMAGHGLVLFAFNPAPSAWLPGYAASSGSHNLTMNTAAAGTATLPLLTDALANASTGDIRSVVWSICEELYQQWVAMGSANQPTEMTITKSATVNPVNGLTTNRYSIAIVTQPTGSTVATEGSGS